MEKLKEERHPQETASFKEVKEYSGSDVPADEIVDNRDAESDAETSSNSSSSSSSDLDSDSAFECDICDKTFSSFLPYKQHLKGKKHAKTVLKKKKEKKLKKIESKSESDEEEFIQEPYAECKMCKKEFGGPEAYEQHLKSKKHKQKLLEASILEQVKVEGKINADKLQDLCKNKRKEDGVVEKTNENLASLTLEDDDEDEEKEEEYECKECEKMFSGLKPYAQHLTSKTHAKRVEKKNLLHKVIPDTSKDDESAEISEVNTLSIEDDILVCKVCSTSFSGPENGVVHLKSKKHAKKLEKYLRKLERKKEKKQSKEEEKKVKQEDESHDETNKEKILPTSDGSLKSMVSNSSVNNTASSQINEELIAREKYKEYKAIMNSLQNDEILKRKF